MSDLFESSVFKLRQRNTLREQLAKALDRIPTDGSPQDWGDVYIPPSHLQALDPDRMVVEGMRGAGKSFWTGVLTNADFRKQLGMLDIGFDLKKSLQSVQDSYRIGLDAGTLETKFPKSNELAKLLALPGVNPETIWMVAILLLFPEDTQLGMPRSTDPYDVWTTPMAWAGLNPARISNGLAFLDRRLSASSQVTLVVIDAIDRASHDLSQVSAMGAGLLRVLLELRFAKGLRIKAFFREDVLSRASPSVVDASKLLNNKVILKWDQNELYSLAFSRIAQHSTYFREQFRNLAGFSWRRDSAQRFVCDKINDIDIQKDLWCALVGNYMGKIATKGHSYPYIFNHLSDGLGRVAPRTFLVALQEALAATVNQYTEKTDHVIHYEAIKDGVRTASSNRVDQLKEEYAWIDPALQCIHSQKETIPMNWTTLKSIWLANTAAVLNEIESMRERSLIPWQTHSDPTIKIEALRTTLNEIGVIKVKMRGNDERIEIPDIYRLAYKIGRKGGIATSKKP